jgi:hypothetical protein
MAGKIEALRPRRNGYAALRCCPTPVPDPLGSRPQAGDKEKVERGGALRFRRGRGGRKVSSLHRSSTIRTIRSRVCRILN